MKRHFLLVDDDVAELRLFMEAFEQMEVDFKCTCAKNMQHARQIMEYITPDNLFIKLDPDIAGNLEEVRNIRKNRKLKTTQIVVYSENMHYYNFIARGHGADFCMKKPYEKQNICEVIKTMLPNS